MIQELTVEYFLAVVGEEGEIDGPRTIEVQSLIDGARIKILAYLSPNGNPVNGTWVTGICETIQMDMVKRAYKNPDLVASDAMGPQSRSFPAAGGLFLLPGEREELDRLKPNRTRNGGLGIVRTYRGDTTGWLV